MVSACMIALCIAIIVLSAQSRLINRAVKKLHNECDPYPLLKETEEQLTYNNSPALRHVLLIDKAAALREIGSLDEAEAVLLELETEISGSESIIQANAIVYFYNLSELYTEKRDYTTASKYYAIMMDKYSRLSSEAVKKTLAHALNGAMILECYRCKDYKQALTLAASAPRKNRKSTVCTAFISAKCCIELGDIQMARYYLSYVISNGGKLCYVDQARKLWTERL